MIKCKTETILFKSFLFYPMINKLLEIFSNYTRSLEILYLLNNLKKAVRLDANEIELKKIKEFCDSKHLHLEISDFKVIKITDNEKGGFSNLVKKVDLNHPHSGLYHIYISKDQNIAKLLKIAEHKNDDKTVGELLNYPNCCIDFFIKNKEKQQKIQNDYILPALKDSEGFKFPFYANYAVRYFDITLLSHFPHNFSCKDSIKIAKSNLECIKKRSNELANKFEKMLKCPVLYTENDGIFMFQDYKINDDILEYKNVISTSKNELFDLLDNKTIEIISKNEVKVMDKVLKDIGMVVFI